MAGDVDDDGDVQKILTVIQSLAAPDLGASSFRRPSGAPSGLSQTAWCSQFVDLGPLHGGPTGVAAVAGRQRVVVSAEAPSKMQLPPPHSGGARQVDRGAQPQEWGHRQKE
jgi:hypothetical protein